MNKHWRENVVSNDNYNIKSSFNQKQLYTTKSKGSFIKDINEPVDYLLDEFKPFKLYKYKVTANCLQLLAYNYITNIQNKKTIKNGFTDQRSCFTTSPLKILT